VYVGHRLGHQGYSSVRSLDAEGYRGQRGGVCIRVEGKGAVLVSFAQSHVRCRHAQDAGLDPFRPLDNGAKLGTRRARSGVSVAITGVLEDDNGFGAAGGLEAVVGF
jgi:hypothetical protein